MIKSTFSDAGNILTTIPQNGNWINSTQVINMKEILSSRLKELRKEKGYTQRKTAILCQITDKAYQNYERQKREPQLAVLVRLAKLFDVSTDYLLGITDKK